MMYKLLIVDDEPLVQAGIKSMLNWAELAIELCGIAMNGQTALEIIEREEPDIVITDIKMPVMSGLELIRICRERYGNERPAFIILTSYEDFQMAKEALRYQVTDYLVKIELTAGNLRAAIDRVLEQASKLSKDRLDTPINLQALYDKFFIRLLNNLFDSGEQFERQAGQLKLDFSYPNYVCAYLEILSAATDRMPLEKQASLFNNTFQMLREIVIKYMPCHIISLDLKHCAVIFCCADRDFTQETAGHIHKILSLVGNTLHKYYNISLKGGIGTAAGQPMEISDSYQYARQAASSALEDNPLVYIEECSTESLHGSLFNISLFKDELSRSFEEFDGEALTQAMDEIISLFRAHPGHFVQALDGACSILYLSISLLPDGENLVSRLFEEDPDNYRSIYRQNSVDQIADWLKTFCDRLCAMFAERRKEHKNHIVSSVKRYIAGHVRERLTLNEVASVFSISPNYLSQLFKKYNDMGFNEYITSLKIREAKSLLADSTLKVYEVADLLGFESAFYFSKVFKKVEGISPTEYQNQKL